MFFDGSEYKQGLYFISPDGTNQRQIVSGMATYSEISPDKKEIVFVGYDGNLDYLYDLYLVNIDGTNLRQLTHTGEVYGDMPSWSPDGSHIIYTSLGGSIKRINPDGTGLTTLYDGGKYIGGVDYSPDGETIVFNKEFFNDGWKYQIYKMNADGTNIQELTSIEEQGMSPEFSPDGKEIAYKSQETFWQENIWVMNNDGSNKRQLTHFSDEWSMGFPTWSPDGTQLVFSKEISGDWVDLFTINVDGTNLKQITHDSLRNISTDWQMLKQ